MSDSEPHRPSGDARGRGQGVASGLHDGCASEPESMDVPEEAEEDSVVTVFVDDVHVALQEEIDGPRSSWMLAGEIGRAHRRNNRQGVKDCRKVVHADT